MVALGDVRRAPGGLGVRRGGSGEVAVELVQVAADKLRDTDATVGAVAREVGYDNAFSFSTAFKRVRGQSPTDWRRGSSP